jgi:hypothetical protein
VGFLVVGRLGELRRDCSNQRETQSGWELIFMLSENAASLGFCGEVWIRCFSVLFPLARSARVAEVVGVDGSFNAWSVSLWSLSSVDIMSERTRYFGAGASILQKMRLGSRSVAPPFC